MKRIVVALLPIAILLTACGSPERANQYAPAPVQEQPREQGSYVELDEVAGTVEKTTLDGVTCYVYDGSSSGGITCDWSHMSDDSTQ